MDKTQLIKKARELREQWMTYEDIAKQIWKSLSFVYTHAKVDIKKSKKEALEITETKDTKQITIENSSRIKNPDDLVKHCKIDTDIWEITNPTVKTWEWYAKNNDGKLETIKLYSVWVKLVRNKEAEIMVKLQDKFLETIKQYSPVVEKLDYKKHKDWHLLEIWLFDLHLDKLCWEWNTGENAHIKITVKKVYKWFERLLWYIEWMNIDKILLVLWWDYFNTDNIDNTTTAWTRQDVDSRWEKAYDIWCGLAIDIIEKLSIIAPVDVVVIQGNHDLQKSFYMWKHLFAWFHNNENINIDTAPQSRKYYSYKKVLLWFAHGNNEKIQDLPLIMAQEQAKNWEKAEYKEFHIGHLHKKKELNTISTDEYKWVTVRHLRCLSSKDLWHHQKGYIWGHKTLEAFLYNDNSMVCNYNIKVK